VIGGAAPGPLRLRPTSRARPPAPSATGIATSRGSHSPSGSSSRTRPRTIAPIAPACTQSQALATGAAAIGSSSDRQQDPAGHVGDEPEPAEDAEHDEGDPNEVAVDAQPVGHTGGDAGNDLAVLASGQAGPRPRRGGGRDGPGIDR